MALRDIFNMAEIDRQIRECEEGLRTLDTAIGDQIEEVIRKRGKDRAHHFYQEHGRQIEALREALHAKYAAIYTDRLGLLKRIKEVAQQF